MFRPVAVKPETGLVAVCYDLGAGGTHWGRFGSLRSKADHPHPGIPARTRSSEKISVWMEG